MSNGQRWLALDADLMGKPFTLDLYHQFGWAGIGTWIAFLCACKRSRIPGTIRFLNEADARAQLGILGWELVDNDGKEWSLTDFWLYTGRKKQTRRTSRGREMNVRATHWGHWQQDAGRARQAEQKRTSREQKRPKTSGHVPDTSRTNVRPDIDLDSDTPLPPTGGVEVTSSENSEKPKNLVGLDTAVGELKATMSRPVPPHRRLLPGQGGDGS